MSLHTLHHQGPREPSSCATFALNSHEGRVATGKKNLASMRAGSLRLCPTLCDPVDCGLPGFSVRGALWARILEHICQYWLSYPSRALAALVASSPEYLVLPEPLLLKQLHHLHTWPSQGQTQVLQGSLRSKPQWIMHIQTWK